MPGLEFRQSAADWVCRHFIPRSWSRGVLLVLAGYVDGSNLHGNTVDVVSVGGCAANAELWTIWENKWNELLRFGGISRWDHAKFMAGWESGKPAQRWSEPDRLIAHHLWREAVWCGCSRQWVKPNSCRRWFHRLFRYGPFKQRDFP
jgi:hypothetical protein